MLRDRYRPLALLALIPQLDFRLDPQLARACGVFTRLDAAPDLEASVAAARQPVGPPGE
jgi:hypothetical protein